SWTCCPSGRATAQVPATSRITTRMSDLRSLNPGSVFRYPIGISACRLLPLPGLHSADPVQANLQARPLIVFHTCATIVEAKEGRQRHRFRTTQPLPPVAPVGQILLAHETCSCLHGHHPIPRP